MILLLKRCLLILFLCVPLAGPVQSQTNPTPAACGLPTSGIINVAVTYTLTADCIQTGQLEIQTVDTVTIVGNGYTIKTGSGLTGFPLLRSWLFGTFAMNNVTFDGEGLSRDHMVLARGTFSATNVTFKGSTAGSGVVVGDNSNTSLTSVLFERMRSNTFAKAGNATALHLNPGATVTMTNAVARDNRYAGGAIVVLAGGSLTANGCLTLYGNIPSDIVGSWTNNSTGACGGTIGNGDPAVIAPPALLPCGLPGPGTLDVSARYTMLSDCDVSGSGVTPVLWVISESVDITIQGNGFSLIGGSGTNYSWIIPAAESTLSFNNIVLDRMAIFGFGELDVTNSTFRDMSYRPFYIFGTGRFMNSLFENIQTAGTANDASVLVAVGSYLAGHATFSNSAFRNNIGSGGAPVLNAFSPATITLNGCITFDGNTPSDFTGNVTDNSSGPCGEGTILGPTGPVADSPSEPPSAPPSPSESTRSEPSTPRKLESCFEQLGAIGFICRPTNVPEPIIQIWVSPLTAKVSLSWRSSNRRSTRFSRQGWLPVRRTDASECDSLDQPVSHAIATSKTLGSRLRSASQAN